MEIPVYLICGFLDSGKTTFINSIFEDGFAQQDKTLFIQCEDGEIDINSKALNNVVMVSIEDEESFTCEKLMSLEKEHKIKQVVIEYNGMWPMQKIMQGTLPDNWILYQVMSFVYAPTFDTYAKNMGQLMMEKIQNADMIVFNRCTPSLKEMLRKRNLRMVNRRADIYLEDEGGTVDNYLTGNEEPFDMSKLVVDIPDDDFGIWYVDAMDHPDRYVGHKVHLKLQACHSKRFPQIHCPGRFAMVCCANDIKFMGVAAKGNEWSRYKDRDWVECTAEVVKQDIPAYKGEGPVLINAKLTPCEKPKNEVVTF